MEDDFWKIEEFTDPNISDSIDGIIDASISDVIDSINSIYMTRNETRSPGERLKLNLSRNGGCHIGCAAWENLDIMCIRRSTYALIVDFNPDNKRFMDATVAIIWYAPTRAKFMEMMTEYLEYAAEPVHFSLKTPEILHRLGFASNETLTPVDEMMWSATLPDSWLLTDDRYEFIRSRVLDFRIYAITQDILNTHVFSAISTFLSDRGIPVDTVYLSNIPVFMSSPADRAAYVTSLLSLVTPKTRVIVCPSRVDNANPLDQRVVTGIDSKNQSRLWV